jgi:hypothetical protein
MTREQAYSKCPADSYVEYYGKEWLIVPYKPVDQPEFFVCLPKSVGTRTTSVSHGA